MDSRAQDWIGAGLKRRDFLCASIAAAVGFSLQRAAFATTVSDRTASDALLDLSLTDVVGRIKSSHLRAQDYVESLLAHTLAHRDLNAFISHVPSQVRSAAKSIDEHVKAGAQLGPLAGAALAIKDNIDVAGYRTTAGTRGLDNWSPAVSAPVAQAVLDAHGIVMGKANMHEMAFGISSNNQHSGAVRNPYNPAMIPGGSSGGTGVAVAARLATAGLGSDTGGSVRVPAALCGVVGFRPTVRRYSQLGVVPISSTRDTVGPMARTVADVRLLDSVLAMREQASGELALQGARLGVPRDFFYENLDAELALVIEDALRQLRAAGAILVDVGIPNINALNTAVSFPVALFEQPREFGVYLARANSGISARQVAEQIAGSYEKTMLMAQLDPSEAVTVQDYQDAMIIHRPALQRAYAEYFSANELVALVVPATPLPARPIGQDDTVELNGKQEPTFVTFMRNADPPTNAALPCLSVPAGLTAGGLPVGLEFVGPHGQDQQILALGAAYEALRPPLPWPSLPGR